MIANEGESMSIRSMSAVLLLTGTVCFAAGAAEKGTLFTPDIVQNVQKGRGEKLSRPIRGKLKSFPEGKISF